MTTKKFSYENRNFASLQEMTEVLLHEVNEQIIRIDMGVLTNTPESRNYSKWRLLHLQFYFGDMVPEVYRSTYNSLWSQLYRLEHQDTFRHPYLKHILEKLHA